MSSSSRRGSPTSHRRCSAAFPPPAPSPAPPPTCGQAGAVRSLASCTRSTLLAILLVAAPLAASVPMAVLAGILLVVSLQHGRVARRAGTVEAGLDGSARLAGDASSSPVVADLTVAVEVGMILAALLFIGRVASTTTVYAVTQAYVEQGRPHILQDKAIPDYVSVLRIHGPFLFGPPTSSPTCIPEIPDSARSSCCGCGT
jgi:SulP family sulfate permease